MPNRAPPGQTSDHMGANGNGVSPPDPGGDDHPGLLPGWVPGPGWRRREPPRSARGGQRRRLRNALLLGAGLSTALALVAAFSSSVSSVTPTITDDGFASAASTLCAPVARQLAEAAEPQREPTDAERAEAIDARVSLLTGMVDGIARLEPAVDDRPAVEAWLGDWRAVLRSGRDTASARRLGDDDAAAEASRFGQAPAAGVDAFALANGMPACAALL